MVAAQANHLHVAALLLQHGASVDLAEESQGRTALILAARNGGWVGGWVGWGAWIGVLCAPCSTCRARGDESQPAAVGVWAGG